MKRMWNNNLENKKIWVVKNKRPPGYQTLVGTAEKFREFLDSEPDIDTIAKELSALVDLLLITGNRGVLGGGEAGEFQLLDTWQKYIPLAWRVGKEKFVADMREKMDRDWEKAKKTFQDWPYVFISAQYTFHYQLGFCEEHALLGLYLLIFGGLHPLSKTLLFPYFEEDRNKKNRDIYFSIVGAGVGKVKMKPFYSKHAIIALLKGKEFAQSIRALKSYYSSDKHKVFEFLLQHPEYWGKNSWIADGWLGYSYPSSKIKEIMVKEFTSFISGIEDVELGPGDIERHQPFHFGNLFNRICRDYQIYWDEQR